MLGPSEFLLSVKQSLSRARVLGLDAWKKNRHSDVIINVRQSHNALWTPRITYGKSNIL